MKVYLFVVFLFLSIGCIQIQDSVIELRSFNETYSVSISIDSDGSFKYIYNDFVKKGSINSDNMKSMVEFIKLRLNESDFNQGLNNVTNIECAINKYEIIKLNVENKLYSFEGRCPSNKQYNFIFNKIVETVQSS